MSLQWIGDRKRRALSLLTGLPIERLMRHSNDLWLARGPVPGGHAHWRIDPRTGEVAVDDGPCWSTCREQPPRVAA